MSQADYDEQLAACPTERDRAYVEANRESIIAYGEAGVYADGSLTPTGEAHAGESATQRSSAHEIGHNNHSVSSPSFSSQMQIFNLNRPEFSNQSLQVNLQGGANAGAGYLMGGSVGNSGKSINAGLMIGAQAQVNGGLTVSSIDFGASAPITHSVGFSFDFLIVSVGLDFSWPQSGSGFAVTTNVGFGPGTPIEVHYTVSTDF